MMCCSKWYDYLTFTFIVSTWLKLSTHRSHWSVAHHALEPKVRQNTGNKSPYLDGQTAISGLMIVVYRLHQSNSYCLPGFNASSLNKYWHNGSTLISPSMITDTYFIAEKYKVTICRYDSTKYATLSPVDFTWHWISFGSLRHASNITGRNR